MASARHAAYGDSLARILERAGNRVEREYYVNDAGSQVRKFGEAIQARARGEEPEEYHGDYVTELAGQIDGAAEADPDELALRGIELMLEGVRAHARALPRADGPLLLRALAAPAQVDAVLAGLDGVYEHDGAVWLRTTDRGDDKDRVLRRSSGELTYFATDIAYHADKLARAYDHSINVLGPDHHGYVKRLQAIWTALGGAPGAYEVVIMQLVNLLKGGKQVQMSKREGEIVTLDELIEDIGVDAARWFLISRSHDTRIDLDLELAAQPVAGQPGLLRPVRARADRLDPAQGGGGARGRGAVGRPARERRELPSLGPLARQAAARAPRRGARGGRAAGAAPHDGLRARDGAGVLGLLPRLPRARRRRGGRRRGRAHRDLRAHQGRDRADARPARGRGARPM